MNYYKRLLSVVIKTTVLLLLYQLLRLCFYALNFLYFRSFNSAEISNVFVNGMLFDISSICTIQSLFFILYLLPFPFIFNKRYITIVDSLFYVSIGLQVLVNAIDCEYFKFINKRTTYDIVKDIFLSNDVLILMPRFLMDFWYIPLLAIGFVFGAWYIIRTCETHIQKLPSVQSKFWQLKAIPLFLLIAALTIVGIRGIGFKPIKLITASRYTTTALFPLIYNTTFTISHTMKGDGLKPLHYFDNKTANRYFNVVHKISKKPQKRLNVVVIILESFSYNYIGFLTIQHSYTPFFDSIAGHSLVFDNAFANGKKSIESLPSIFASIPNLLEEPYITSQYGGNTIEGLPSILRKQGYATSFFHGGRNGTMSFDNFCKASGIEKYYGLNEYKGPEAYDGDWGIRDEEFLQFFATELSNMTQPFFSSVFTLSSHHPYIIPKKYRNRFKGGTLPIYKSIEYADYSLQQFFKRIEKEDWFKNTVFVFTADHAAQEEDYSSKSRADLFRIPLMFYCPSDTNLIGLNHSIAQQTDIMPSILDYIGVSGTYVCFGSSLFDRNPNRVAVQYLSGVYSLIRNNYSISFDGEKLLEIETIDKSKDVITDTDKDSMLNIIKSISQQFNGRLIRNEMIFKK